MDGAIRAEAVTPWLAEVWIRRTSCRPIDWHFDAQSRAA
jgi:hypothetical protein